MVDEGSRSHVVGTGSARPLILVVDDDAQIREAMASFLNDEGFEVVQAGDGFEALDVIADSDRPPTLILLDLMMPILDGWTFCKIRQGIKALMEIPVIAVSAASMVGSREPLRADAVLPKPFDPDQLAWLAARLSRHGVRR
jgi:CheY-like chemotaxis protein